MFNGFVCQLILISSCRLVQVNDSHRPLNSHDLVVRHTISEVISRPKQNLMTSINKLFSKHLINYSLGAYILLSLPVVLLYICVFFCLVQSK